ncbi:hypothetical protein E2C01_059013 [Portunus trituberculatus]|uniref:Uncharacterized protein n=1 Tax=Portunus trituberculatus TaxID=210409 RepID=A0A5B7GX23_PORTR|nr:hypothetical protein [Portunus trituberculatus]
MDIPKTSSKTIVTEIMNSFSKLCSREVFGGRQRRDCCGAWEAGRCNDVKCWRAEVEPEGRCWQDLGSQREEGIPLRRLGLVAAIAVDVWIPIRRFLVCWSNLGILQVLNPVSKLWCGSYLSWGYETPLLCQKHLQSVKGLPGKAYGLRDRSGIPPPQEARRKSPQPFRPECGTRMVTLVAISTPSRAVPHVPEDSEC